MDGKVTKKYETTAKSEEKYLLSCNISVRKPSEIVLN